MTVEQGSRHIKGDAACGAVVLPAVAPIGEVSCDGLTPRLEGGGRIAIIRLNVGQDSPRGPRLQGMTELLLALDGPTNLPPRVVEAAKPSQGIAEKASAA